MKTLQRDHRFDSRLFGKDAWNTKDLTQRRLTRTTAPCARRPVGTLARIFSFALALAFLPVVHVAAQSAQEWKLPDIPWAFPIRDKVQPVIDERIGPQHV